MPAQRRYDHRLRELVRFTGDVTIATDLGVPRSTARGWLRVPQTAVVTLDVTELTDLELRHEVLTLQRQVQKLAVLLQLALTLLCVAGLSFAGERLPDGRAKVRILSALTTADRILCGLASLLLNLLRFGVPVHPETALYPWNFSPILPICLFGGAIYASRGLVYGVPWAA